MRTSSPEVPRSPAGHSSESDELAALRTVHWRTRHELHALLDTVAVYRRAAAELAEENADLRHALAESRAPSTRRTTLAAQQRFEVRIACDEFAADVVALAVGEALEDTHTAELVEAWQLIAFEMADETISTDALSGDDMITLRMRHSPRAVGMEVTALEG
jgi:hypothetical protein